MFIVPLFPALFANRLLADGHPIADVLLVFLLYVALNSVVSSFL
jgi:hypothetical protein